MTPAKTWKTIAESLELDLTSNEGGSLLSGRLHDEDIVISVTAQGEATFEVACVHEGLEFRLLREELKHRLSKLVGTQDIQVGEAEFDKRLLIQGKSPEDVIHWLDAKRRAAILKLLDTLPDAEISEREIRVMLPAKSVDVANARRCATALVRTATRLRGGPAPTRPELVSPLPNTLDQPVSASSADPTPPSESPANPQALAILAGVRKRQVSSAQIAEALMMLGQMHVVVPAEEMSSMMGAMTPDTAVPSKGPLNPKRVLEHILPGGETAATAFTSHETLHRHQGAQTSPVLTCSWAAGLRNLMIQGYGHLIIDPGSEHEFDLESTAISMVLAWADAPRLAESDLLRVVVGEDGAVAVTSDRNGKGIAFTYSDDESAQAGLPKLAAAFPGAHSVRSLETGRVLSSLVNEGIEFLTVNSMLKDERAYLRGQLETLAAWAGQRQLLQDESSPLSRATRGPRWAPVEVKSADEADSRIAVLDCIETIKDEAGELWALIEKIAWDLDVYAPVHPQAVDGLTWPQMYPHPDDENKIITFLFSTAERAEEGLKEKDAGWQRRHRISMFEALRWIWAAPRNMDEVAIDFFADEALRFPNNWALSAIFPSFLEVPSLAGVEPAELSRLGARRGAHGLSPDIAKTLLTSAATLQGPLPGSVTIAGGRWLPVFTSDEARQTFGGVETATGNAWPWLDFLEASSDADGVVLDPGGAAPLTLNHTELAFLSQWRPAGPKPSLSEVIKSLVPMQRGGGMSPRMVGRLLADYPRYFVLVERRPDGQVMFGMLPGSDTLVFFSSPELAQSWLDGYSESQAEVKMKPMPILSRWTASVFGAAKEGFGAAALNPPTPDGGEDALHLNMEALDAALERLQEKLKPRIPGFVWGEPTE